MFARLRKRSRPYSSSNRGRRSPLGPGGGANDCTDSTFFHQVSHRLAHLLRRPRGFSRTSTVRYDDRGVKRLCSRYVFRGGRDDGDDGRADRGSPVNVPCAPNDQVPLLRCRPSVGGFHAYLRRRHSVPRRNAVRRRADRRRRWAGRVRVQVTHPEARLNQEDTVLQQWVHIVTIFIPFTEIVQNRTTVLYPYLHPLPECLARARRFFHFRVWGYITLRKKKREANPIVAWKRSQLPLKISNACLLVRLLYTMHLLFFNRKRWIIVTPMFYVRASSNTHCLSRRPERVAENDIFSDHLLSYRHRCSP